MVLGALATGCFQQPPPSVVVPVPDADGGEILAAL